MLMVWLTFCAIIRDLSALENLKETADEMRIKELAFKKQQREQDRIIRELLNARKHLRDENTIAKEKSDKAAKLEKETVAKRVHNIQYYGEQAKLMSAEATDRMKLKHNHDATLFRTFDEFEQRQFDRTKLQVDSIPTMDDRIRLPNGNELGVFAGGKNSGLKEPQSEMDDLFLEDNLYDAIQMEAKRLKQSVEQMKDMRDLLQKDQIQINQEQHVIANDQLGPPRRLAMAAEIQAIDLWKNRSSALEKRLKELEYSIDKAESMKIAMDSQILTVAKSVASLQEAAKKGKADADDINGELGMLPMVVGRGLQHVAGLNAQTAKPKEMFNAITHQSRLVDIKDQSVTAAKLHRERTALDQDIWLERLKENGKNADLESVVSRLVEISERLQRSGVDTMRLNIIDSMKGFLKSGLALNVVRRKLVEDDKITLDDSNSGEPFANGVTLGDGRTGQAKRDKAKAEMSRCGVWEAAANKAERITGATLLETRSAWAQNHAFEQLIDTVIMAMIADVAEEAHSEGRVAK
eukprot:gene23560-29787_t